MVKDNVVFQDKITAPANGIEYEMDNLQDETSITVTISGTATARTVIFEAKGLVGNYLPVCAFNESTMTMATQTTGVNDEMWTIDLTGKSRFRCRVSAVSGGNLSVAGKVIQ